MFFFFLSLLSLLFSGGPPTSGLMSLAGHLYGISRLFLKNCISIYEVSVLSLAIKL